MDTLTTPNRLLIYIRTTGTRMLLLISTLIKVLIKQGPKIKTPMVLKLWSRAFKLLRGCLWLLPNLDSSAAQLKACATISMVHMRAKRWVMMKPSWLLPRNTMSHGLLGLGVQIKGAQETIVKTSMPTLQDLSSLILLMARVLTGSIFGPNLPTLEVQHLPVHLATNISATTIHVPNLMIKPALISLPAKQCVVLLSATFSDHKIIRYLSYTHHIHSLNER
jgi:hypothetical protein